LGGENRNLLFKFLTYLNKYPGGYPNVNFTYQFHKLAKNSQIMIYPRLGHSHHISYFHPEVVGFIADFMVRELPPEIPVIPE